MKTLLRVLLVLLVLVVAAGAAAWFYLDRIVAETVERGGTYALGVETRVEKARLDLGRRTSLGLQGLFVANPEGFRSPHFLRMGSTAVEVEARTLLRDDVVVPLVEARDVDVVLERSEGRTNYGVILEHLERFESEDPPPEEQPTEKRLSVGTVRIVGVNATVDLVPVGGDLSRFSIHVPEILLEDVEEGLTVSELVALVVKTLLTATVNEGRGILPPDLLDDLQGELADLKQIAYDIQGEVVRQAEEALEKGAEEAREAVEKEIGEALGGQAGKVLEGLGGKKKPPPEDGGER